MFHMRLEKLAIKKTTFGGETNNTMEIMVLSCSKSWKHHSHLQWNIIYRNENNDQLLQEPDNKCIKKQYDKYQAMEMYCFSVIYWTMSYCSNYYNRLKYQQMEITISYLNTEGKCIHHRLFGLNKLFRMAELWFC